MGLLVDGVWQDDVSRTKDGHFIRPAAQFRNWVTPDGSPARPATAAFRPSPAAITSTSRSPARGRTAPSFSASSRRSKTSFAVDRLAQHGSRRLDLRQSRGLEPVTP